MENYFKAYTRLVQGTPYYFVKKYTIFPEDPHIPDILEKMGMHTEFLAACALVGLQEGLVIDRLFQGLQEQEAMAPVIPMHLDKGMHAIS